MNTLHNLPDAGVSNLQSALDTGADSSLTPDAATASPSAAVSYHLYLPSDLTKKDYSVFEMQHHNIANMKFMPLSKNTAVNLLDTLRLELNEKFMTDLCPINLDDDSSSSKEGEDEEEAEANPYDDLRLIIVGGSHAARIASAADNLGVEVENLAVPGFRISDNSVENSAILLEDSL
jgi:hypothetical protein